MTTDWPADKRPLRASDFDREEAAYQRERERLVREHLGKIALIHQDTVVGAFSTADEAILEAVDRFGADRVMLREIRDPDEPDFISLCDPNDPLLEKE